MPSIQIPIDLQQRLSAYRSGVELHDQDGQLVGYFVPSPEFDQDLWERVRNTFTDEEIAKASQQTGEGWTLQEILADLEAKWPST